MKNYQTKMKMIANCHQIQDEVCKCEPMYICRPAEANVTYNYIRRKTENTTTTESKSSSAEDEDDHISSSVLERGM